VNEIGQVLAQISWKLYKLTVVNGDAFLFQSVHSVSHQIFILSDRWKGVNYDSESSKQGIWLYNTYIRFYLFLINQQFQPLKIYN